MLFIFLTWFTLISQLHNNRIYPAVPESREHLQHEQMGFPRQGSVKLNISGSTTAENRYVRVETEALLCSETQVRDGTQSCRTSLPVFSLPRLCLHRQCPGTLLTGSRSIPRQLLPPLTRQTTESAASLTPRASPLLTSFHPHTNPGPSRGCSSHLRACGQQATL